MGWFMDYGPQRELFFENPKLLGLGRQIGPKILGAFRVFLAKLQHVGGIFHLLYLADLSVCLPVLKW